MSHIIPAHKKNDIRSLNNYCPVSLLPICGKFFERIIYNNVFLFVEDNNLLTPNQEKDDLFKLIKLKDDLFKLN